MHTHSLTVLFPSASLPYPVHSLQPLPKSNVQALNPAEPHTYLAVSSLRLLRSVGVHPYHGAKHVLCMSLAAFASLEVNEAYACYSFKMP